ncbi:hypothetical protein A2363_01555 [Candidatus Gottesmanbacteria bacterium RIFOXYB1_FULL_47_11]|uniref:Uncharacterized protein n=1 Tax=Candidatus Gottesmanbacteria bacterium RIFOXYB1_FULL_47_11 TaxID=1798401 RepID=A0A1F6BGH0_9BACT|nr:MAG: hypothetical protein A2363_01555 [Candidatus Gottesmanbacteria bacterium RIFOXYB1_FULL_47_11]
MQNRFEELHERNMGEPPTPFERGVVLATGTAFITTSLLPFVGPEGALKIAEFFQQGTNSETPWIVGLGQVLRRSQHTPNT